MLWGYERFFPPEKKILKLQIAFHAYPCRAIESFRCLEFFLSVGFKMVMLNQLSTVET